MVDVSMVAPVSGVLKQSPSFRDVQEDFAIQSSREVSYNPPAGDSFVLSGVENIQSSADWYNQVAKLNLDPETRKFFVDSSKEIRTELGLGDRISDEEIETYIQQGYLEELDNIFLNEAKISFDVEKERKKDEALIGVGEASKILEIYEAFDKVQFPYSRDNIIAFRADQASKYKAKRASGELPSYSDELQSALNKEREETAYKVDYLLQVDKMLSDKIEKNPPSEGFSELMTESLPFLTPARLYTALDKMQEMGIIKDQKIKDQIISSVFSGSGYRALGEFIMGLPKEDFNKLMDEAATTNLFTLVGGVGTNPIATQTFIRNILGMSTGDVLLYNVTEPLSLIGAAGSARAAIKGAKQAVQVNSFMKAFDSFVTANKTAEELKAWNLFKKTKEGKTVMDAVKQGAASTTELRDIYRKFMNDPQFKELHDLFREGFDSFVASVREEIAIQEELKKAAKKTKIKPKYRDKTLDADFTVMKETDVGDATNIGPEIKTRQSQEDLGTSLVKSTLQGSEATTDSLMGARLHAADGFVKKAVDAGLKGEDVDAETLFSMVPSWFAGAPRNSVPFYKSHITGEEIAPNDYFMSRKELSEAGFNVPGIALGDTALYNKLSEDAKLSYETALQYFNSLPVDVKHSQFAAEETSSGLRTSMLFGIGPRGDFPLPESIIDEIKGFAKEGGFNVVQDSTGNWWLETEGFLNAKGLWTPIESKQQSDWLTYWLGSIETTQPAENIETLRYGVQKGAGVLARRKDNFKKVTKGMSKEQVKEAEGILRDMWHSQKTLSDEDLYMVADYDDKVVSLVQTVLADTRLEGSFKNNFKRETLEGLGYRSFDFSVVPHDVQTTIKALDPDLDFFSDLIFAKPLKTVEPSKNVIDFTTGEIKDITSVDKGKKLVQFMEPEYVTGVGEVNKAIIPENFRDFNLPSQVIGQTVLAGWNYNAKWFLKYPKQYGPSEVMKTISYDSNPIRNLGIEKQKRALQEWSQTYLDKSLSLTEANKRILQTSLKNGITGIRSRQDFEDFLKAHKMEDLPQKANRIQIAPNNAAPFDLSKLGDDESVRLSGIGTAHRFKRGETPVVNLRNSVVEADLVPLHKHEASLIRKMSRYAGPAPVASMLSNRWLARYGHLIDWSKRPSSATDVLSNLDTYALPEAKQNFASDYAYAKYDADSMLRAFQSSRQDTDVQRMVYSTYEAISKTPGLRSISDLMRSVQPTKRLEGLIYNLWSAASLKQMVLQGGVVQEALLQHPVHGARATAVYFPLRYMINVIKRGGDLNKEAEILAKFPSNLDLVSQGLLKWSAQDIKAMGLKAVEMGLEDARINDVRGLNMSENFFSVSNIQSMVNGLLELSNLPREKGNIWARALSLPIACSEREKEIGRKVHQFTERDWANVISKVDIYSGGLSTANRRAFTELPIVRPLTMMSSFLFMQLEKLLGPTVFGSKQFKQSFWDRAKFVSLMLAWYGAEYVLPTPEAGEVSYQIEKHTGVPMNDIRNGLLGAILSSLAGYRVDTGSYSPHLLDNFVFNCYKALAGKEDFKISELATFYTSSIKTLTGSLVSLKDIWLSKRAPADPNVKTMDVGDRAVLSTKTVLRNLTAFRDWEKTAMACIYNVALDSEGFVGYQKDYQQKDLCKKAINNAVFGIKDSKQTDRYINYYITQNQEKAIDDSMKVAAKMLKTAYEFDLQGNRKAHDEYMMQYEDFKLRTATAFGWNDIQIDWWENQARKQAIKYQGAGRNDAYNKKNMILGDRLLQSKQNEQYFERLPEQQERK